MLDFSFQFEWFDGVIYVLPQCMGYRSLIALTMLSALCGFFHLSRWRDVAKLVMLSVLIAVTGNLLRIAAIMCVCAVSYDLAFSVIHETIGYVIFVVEVLVVAEIAERMKKGGRHGHTAR